ncbi:MAG TPA: hypothetical protein VK864_07200 [Longimicrobiales bacterium]|nr:hypothetical protein [Longimicrobiales bacterium]
MRLLIAALVCLLAGGDLQTAQAQLISPGKLSAAHSSVEGLRKCTECHELGQRGTSNARCQSCHEPIKTRMAGNQGYHATVKDQPCGSCHKEHLGTAVHPTRFDTATFKHTDTGFELKGGHVEAGCRSCHTPGRITAADVRAVTAGMRYLQRTFLGVGASCLNCHRAESPHGKQFGTRGCEACHDERDWHSAPRFDHAETDYALTGKHRTVECSGCHGGNGGPETMRWSNLEFGACADCHRDPHAGKMTGACSSCHSTAGWQRIDAAKVESKFDHSRTRFALHGAHARADCALCHQPQRDARDIAIRFVASTQRFTFARPIVSSCASCHVDPHPARLKTVAGTNSCAACHTEQRWLPTTYGLARHDQLETFPLTGAHAVVTCKGCHAEARTNSAFMLPGRSCQSCHAKDDPHKQVYAGRECSECHRTTNFKDTFFDHARAKAAACTSCHQAQDPHLGQFRGLACDRCHLTTTFRVERFDHQKTRYPLDGEHALVACNSCHRPERSTSGRVFTRYKPLETTCAACHGGAQ